MTLTDLATQHRWRLTRVPFDGSPLGDQVVQGKRGQLWDNSDTIGMTVLATPKVWGAARRHMLQYPHAALTQNGDAEGAITFNPDDPIALAAAARLCQIRARRIPSPALLARLEKMRENATAIRRKGTSGPRVDAEPKDGGLGSDADSTA